MTEHELKELRKIAEEATPGPWGPSWGANYPFYVEVKKPAPSMSKHDHERPTYWRYKDGVFVAAFDPKKALELLDYIEKLEKSLNKKKRKKQ